MWCWDGNPADVTAGCVQSEVLLRAPAQGPSVLGCSEDAQKAAEEVAWRALVCCVQCEVWRRETALPDFCLL